MTDCPPATSLALYLAGDIGPDRHEQITQHVSACAHCQSRLRYLESSDTQPTMHGVEQSTLVAARLQIDLAKTQIGRYHLCKCIGQGGMGMVYLAEDRRLKRQVALKVLSDAFDTSTEHIERLRREAQMLAELNHPNIVSVYELGEARGTPFLALEYLPHGTLSELTDGTPQEIRQVARLMIQVARGIAFTHARGIVHRDLKPNNLLLKSRATLNAPAVPPKGGPVCLDDWIPKIADFGIAKTLGDNHSLTLTGHIVGSPNYMAPEQALGQPSGPLADQYSLGVILYELLTGRPPFQSPHPHLTLKFVIDSTPVSLRAIRPDVPKDLETICLKCLEKSPADRYTDTQELAEELERFLAGMPILAQPMPWTRRLWRASVRKPAWAVVAALSLMLVLTMAIGGVVLASVESARRESAEQAARDAEQNAAKTRDALVQAEAATRASQSYAAALQTEYEQNDQILSKVMMNMNNIGLKLGQMDVNSDRDKHHAMNQMMATFHSQVLKECYQTRPDSRYWTALRLDRYYSYVRTLNPQTHLAEIVTIEAELDSYFFAEISKNCTNPEWVVRMQPAMGVQSLCMKHANRLEQATRYAEASYQLIVTGYENFAAVTTREKYQQFCKEYATRLAELYRATQRDADAARIEAAHP